VVLEDSRDTTTAPEPAASQRLFWVAVELFIAKTSPSGNVILSAAKDLRLSWKIHATPRPHHSLF